jgi:hypothetical protein
MKLKKGMKIKFRGFGWIPELNKAGLCLDSCKALKSAHEQALDWPSPKDMWLVCSPKGRGYWIHSCQAVTAKDSNGK